MGVCARIALPNSLPALRAKIAFTNSTNLLFFLQKEGYQLAYGRLNNKKGALLSAACSSAAQAWCGYSFRA
jgi:hypothetical protein